MEHSNEENISTQSPPAQENARLPNPDAVEGGPRRAGAPSPQGAPPFGGVSTKHRDESLRAGVRLRHNREFRDAYERGRRVVSRYFVAFILAKRDGGLRLGVVASRRVGGAVARNRAKRLLREVFRKRKPDRAVSADLVLVARGAINEATYWDVDTVYQRSVRKLVEKIP